MTLRVRISSGFVNVPRDAVFATGLHALCGLSGSGKSTLLRLVSNIERRDAIVDVCAQGAIHFAPLTVHEEYGILTVRENLETAFANARTGPNNAVDIDEYARMWKITDALSVAMRPSKLDSENLHICQLAVALAAASPGDTVCIDELGNGLNPFRLSHVCKTLESMSKSIGLSILASVHPQSSSILAQFQSITFIAEGRLSRPLTFEALVALSQQADSNNASSSSSSFEPTNNNGDVVAQRTSFINRLLASSASEIDILIPECPNVGQSHIRPDEVRTDYRGPCRLAKVASGGPNSRTIHQFCPEMSQNAASTSQNVWGTYFRTNTKLALRRSVVGIVAVYLLMMVLTSWIFNDVYSRIPSWLDGVPRVHYNDFALSISDENPVTGNPIAIGDTVVHRSEYKQLTNELFPAWLTYFVDGFNNANVEGSVNGISNMISFGDDFDVSTLMDTVLEFVTCLGDGLDISTSDIYHKIETTITTNSESLTTTELLAAIEQTLYTIQSATVGRWESFEAARACIDSDGGDVDMAAALICMISSLLDVMETAVVCIGWPALPEMLFPRPPSKAVAESFSDPTRNLSSFSEINDNVVLLEDYSTNTFHPSGIDSDLRSASAEECVFNIDVTAINHLYDTFPFGRGVGRLAWRIISPTTEAFKHSIFSSVTQDLCVITNEILDTNHFMAQFARSAVETIGSLVDDALALLWAGIAMPGVIFVGVCVNGCSALDSALSVPRSRSLTNMIGVHGGSRVKWFVSRMVVDLTIVFVTSMVYTIVTLCVAMRSLSVSLDGSHLDGQVTSGELFLKSLISGLFMFMTGMGCRYIASSVSLCFRHRNHGLVAAGGVCVLLLMLTGFSLREQVKEDPFINGLSSLSPFRWGYAGVLNQFWNDQTRFSVLQADVMKDVFGGMYDSTTAAVIGLVAHFIVFGSLSTYLALRNRSDGVDKL